MGTQRRVIVSAVNLVDGGPLTILRDALIAFDKEAETRDIEVEFLVSNPEVHSGLKLANIKFRYFPLAKKSWFFRLFYEYIYFYFLSLILNVDVWFSLHDITPNVKARKRYVYCHNPSMFLDFPWADASLDLKQFLFSKFYKYLYKINIKKNSAVIVQQYWLAKKFREIFEVENTVVAYPDLADGFDTIGSSVVEDKNKIVFYPAFPRYFKNHQIVLEVANRHKDLSFLLTIDGTENSFIKKIIKKNVNPIDNVRFLGLVSRDRVLSYYERSSFLLFPSLLETWGLPLTEYRRFDKPIVCADLPYARETLNRYPKVYWFDPDDVESLDRALHRAKNGYPFDDVSLVSKDPYSSFVSGWKQLVGFLVD